MIATIDSDPILSGQLRQVVIPAVNCYRENGEYVGRWLTAGDVFLVIKFVKIKVCPAIRAPARIREC